MCIQTVSVSAAHDKIYTLFTRPKKKSIAFAGSYSSLRLLVIFFDLLRRLFSLAVLFFLRRRDCIWRVLLFVLFFCMFRLGRFGACASGADAML